MLLGRPPFETTNLKETYRCIREARYTMPSSLMPPAKQLIASMLSKNPQDRPSLNDIMRHEFFTQVRCSARLLMLNASIVSGCVLQEYNHISMFILQGFTPERLSSSCCHSAPDFHLSSPAKNFFKKAAAALFGGKKEKAKYYDNLSKYFFVICLPQNATKSWYIIPLF